MPLTLVPTPWRVCPWPDAVQQYLPIHPNTRAPFPALLVPPLQGHHKTYYHVKDISYLLHEPLLKKARELYAFEKKVRRAKAKQNKELAARLAARKPSYRLDHLVRERYAAATHAGGWAAGCGGGRG